MSVTPTTLGRNDVELPNGDVVTIIADETWVEYDDDGHRIATHRIRDRVTDAIHTRVFTDGAPPAPCDYPIGEFRADVKAGKLQPAENDTEEME